MRTLSINSCRLTASNETTAKQQNSVLALILSSSHPVMAPTLSSLYTLSFTLAVLTTLFVTATLRLIAILPNARSKTHPWRKPPLAARVLVILGSGGHTHEMFYLLRDLDTAKYTHRTYVVSSGDAFSAQRAVEFERVLEARAKQASKKPAPHAVDVTTAGVAITATNPSGGAATSPIASTTTSTTAAAPQAHAKPIRQQPKLPCVGPDHYNVAVVTRARRIHQSLLTTPFSCLATFYSCFAPLLGVPPIPMNQAVTTPYEAAAADVPDLIIANGPATAVIMVLASLVLRFFDVRGANTRHKCKTVYVESFARVKKLSLSGQVLVRLVDRFVVQWESLEGAGGRAEFWGVLV